VPVNFHTSFLIYVYTLILCMLNLSVIILGSPGRRILHLWLTNNISRTVCRYIHNTYS